MSWSGARGKMWWDGTIAYVAEPRIMFRLIGQIEDRVTYQKAEYGAHT